MTDLQKAKEKYYKQISKYIFGVDSEHPASVYIKELEKSNAEMLGYLIRNLKKELWYLNKINYQETIENAKTKWHVSEIELVEKATGQKIEDILNDRDN